MTQKSKGGRGQKAENPYERLSLTLPPHLKAYLDAQAEAHHLNRSEMVALILEEHQTRTTTTTPQAPEKRVVQKPSEEVAGPSTALTAPSNSHDQDTDQEGEVLQVVMTEIPRHIRGQLRWSKEKYQQAEEKLRQGKTLSRLPGKADWQTEKGEVVSWRTVEALMKQGVVT